MTQNFKVLLNSIAVLLLAWQPLTTSAATQGSIDLAQQMYVAYYGRPGDPDGVNFWAEKFDQSNDLSSILSNFGNSEEYTNSFASLSNEQQINGLFQQMFNRDSDSEGLAFYVERLASGAATLASIAKQIADGAVNEDLISINNKITIANTFTTKIIDDSLSYGASDIESAQALLSAVDSAQDTVTLAESSVAEWAPLSAFILSSSAMIAGGDLPITYTCDGDSLSPPLSWTGAPENTIEFALVMDHVAAPDDVHWYWLMYNIDSGVSSLDAGQTQGTLGTNSVNSLNEYAPPCSQGPGVKLYSFTLYALSASPDLGSSIAVDRDALLSAIEDITLESAELSVSYERSFDTDLSACETIQLSVSEAGYNGEVAVTCDDNYAYITSDTYPDHDLMNGITGSNEQIPVPAINYAAPIKLAPQLANELTTVDAAVGVAINGVPIYDYSAQGELDPYVYDADIDTVALGQLDNCGGHAGRGDDYHYHASPNCMIDSMANAGDQAIIGWGYDGYPLYGNNNPDGSVIAEGELDVCNGQIDDDFTYRYHTSTEAPYIIQCLMGEVDIDILPRVAPLSGDTNGARSDLSPPQGGVENLSHTIAADGTRTMTYTYNSSEYYVSYSPSSSEDYCYDFEQKTVSSGGIVETGTLCRDAQDAPSDEQAEAKTFKLEAWSDNWFSAYLENDLIVEDSVSIETERSFNSETATFTGTYPLQLNFILKDFKENDTGLEYIGENNQQMGDGGFIAQITDLESDQIIAVSNGDWKCEVLHQAPLDKSCENEANPIAGTAPCGFTSSEEPSDWKDFSFNDSSWEFATSHSEADVSPKDGYEEINWSESAQLIWGADLETDNTLICRITIEQP